MVREGGCLCGAIRYRADGAPLARGLCHCETCRRTASAPSLPFATYPAAAVTILRGAPAAFRSSPHVVRSFCGVCGSPLFYRNDTDSEHVDVMTCSLDAPDDLPPEFSVWTSVKISWDVPNPTCPAYARSRAEAARP